MKSSTQSRRLIREQFNRKDSLLIRHPKPLRYHNLAYIISDILVKAGIQTVEHVTESKMNGRIRKDVMRAHGFRKLTETSFIRSKVNAEAREMLMGHSIGLGDAYYRPDNNEILEEYLKAIVSPHNKRREPPKEKGYRAS